MKKISILKRKIIRNYNNKDNWAYSRRKGYPKETYFGYSSFKSYMDSMLKDYKWFYGNSLRKWRYI